LGWWYLLRAFKKHDIIEMYLNGVTPEYQGKGAVALYYYYMAKAYLDAGFKTAVSSLQLEENAKALTIWKNFEHRQHITHRCWTKDI
jgi:endonuclease I